MSAPRKGVRFEEDEAVKDEIVNKRKRDAALDTTFHVRGSAAKRSRPNDHEDNDDLELSDQDGDTNVISERDLWKAKHDRRIQPEIGVTINDDDNDGEDDTHIDRTTSLAAEGITIEPFSMEKEKNDGTGYFDGDTYVFRKRLEDEEPDAWLESLKDGNDETAFEKQAEDDTSNTSNDNTDEVIVESAQNLYAKIISLVGDKETVTQAIIRYGKLIHRKDPAATRAHESLNQLTEAANALLLQGQVDIYQMTKSELAKFVPIEEKPNVMWEYLGSEDGKIHGPYSSNDMLNWTRAGYFVGDSAVQIRTVQQVESISRNSMKDDLLDDLLGDDDGDDKPLAKQSVQGEWMQSDACDFSKYS
jgi:hypothetical protein